MKVLFRTSVHPFKAGQLAEVAEGYAKNYLIPKNLAVPATAHAMQEAHKQEQKHHDAEADAAHDLDALARALTGATVHVTARAAASGTLYAAVNPAQIAEALAKHTGHPFPKPLQKQLPTLKRTGRFPVTLQIHATTITFTLDV